MWRGGRYLKIRGAGRVLTSSHHEPGGTILVTNILLIATYVFVGLGSVSRGQAPVIIRENVAAAAALDIQFFLYDFLVYTLSMA